MGENGCQYRYSYFGVTEASRMASYGRGHEGTFWGRWNVSHLDFGGGYLGERLCKNLCICTAEINTPWSNQQSCKFRKIKKVIQLST